MATAFPLPSTATPVSPPACPARTGSPAAALPVPAERTEYDTPERVRHTVTAVPLLPRPTVAPFWRYADAATVTGVPQVPVRLRLIATTAPLRIPTAHTTTTASPPEFTASFAEP